MHGKNPISISFGENYRTMTNLLQGRGKALHNRDFENFKYNEV